jgi:uncharacterized membrane protein
MEQKGYYLDSILVLLGGGLLYLLTFVIGFLWLIPYIQTASANFYEDLKKNYINDDVVAAGK